MYINLFFTSFALLYMNIFLNFTSSLTFYLVYVQSVKKKKKKTPIYFNTNYCTEMKLVPTIMDYCLLQFDSLKFFLGVRLHGGLYLTLIFSA